MRIVPRARTYGTFYQDRSKDLLAAIKPGKPTPWKKLENVDRLHDAGFHGRATQLTDNRSAAQPTDGTRRADSWAAR